MSSIANYFKDVFKNRKVLWDLVKNDFKAKYTNSLLGIAWAFLVPLITILVLWFVFEKGFRSGPMNGVPFILWYIPAFLVDVYKRQQVRFPGDFIVGGLIMLDEIPGEIAQHRRQIIPMGKGKDMPLAAMVQNILIRI